ncbi:hypothetical protein J2T16_005385 [Paenibacillus intestini]|nr:hypothetical protein [Paenibacillus intestini]
MNKYGLLIERLILSNGSEQREVKFFEGLNVISGPTDTGKTYVYQCLKYLLGSNDSPKTIPENKDYSDAYLEIFSYTKDSWITLKREFNTNKIRIYSCAFDRINSDTVYISVNTRGSSNLISSKMLEYIGFISKEELRTHVKQDKYRKIAFRDFLHFSLIDEKEVIKDKSVLTTGQYTSRTVELNAFFYFLTGKYTSFLTYLSKLKGGKEKKEKPQVDKSDYYLDLLINDTQRELDSLNVDDSSSTISFKEELLFVTSEIEEQSKLFKESFENIEKLKSKRLMNQELIKRFTLLMDHFKSDLQRLDFILEGGSIISNLGAENCPRCGKKLDDFHNDTDHDKAIEDISYEILFSSYSSEKEKIILNINDLNVTIENLEMDNRKINELILLDEKKYTEIKQNIDDQLKPTKDSLQEKINNQIDAKLIRAKMEYLKNLLNKLNLQRENLILPIKQTVVEGESTSENKEIVDERLVELTKLMNGFLVVMKFPELNPETNNVSFDIKEYDFVINGKARSVYGKGFRSIIYSVFVISLMVYCQKNNLPHTGFVVIDSPLTTYQEAGGDDDEDKIPEELKVRFINTFTNIKDSQVIILENKFSMNIDNEKINLIKFTKDRRNGRYGFM